MEASIKDKDKNIVKALNMLGFRLDSRHVEIILNVTELVSKKGSETSLRDLIELEQCVNSLYKD